MFQKILSANLEQLEHAVEVSETKAPPLQAHTAKVKWIPVCQVECLPKLSLSISNRFPSACPPLFFFFTAAAALLLFHIYQNVLSLHVVTRIASKGTDWREMKCVFKCKGTVRLERRGGLKGFRKMGFQAFLSFQVWG